MPIRTTNLYDEFRGNNVSKNGNGKKKTVAELREALQRLEDERAGYVTTIEESEAAIKQCARQIFDGDGEAGERRKGYKMRRTTARDALEQIDMILPDLQQDLAEAIAAEAQVVREADAVAAIEYAKSLPLLFQECDRHLANFRRSYVSCIDAVREARGRKWSVPSEELMASKMMRAIKSALSVAELRGLDIAAEAAAIDGTADCCEVGRFQDAAAWRYWHAAAR
jgi:hypothetical protein